MADIQPGETTSRSRDGPTAEVPQLVGAQKVAALLLSMDKRLASRLLKHFDEEDIKVIAQTATDLGAVAQATVGDIIEEFATNLKSGGDLMASIDEVEQLLSGAVSDEQISEIMAQVRTQSLQTIWRRLGSVPESILSPYLAKEHPQISAFVLSRAPPAYVANILGRLPQELVNEIISRMLSTKAVLEIPLKILEDTISKDLLSRTGADAGPTIHARLANIINKMDRKDMDDTLNDLEAHYPKDADLVRGLLFTFDDIAKLSEDARLVLFDQVPPDLTIVALHGAQPGFRDLVLEVVPTRSRRMIEQELASDNNRLTKEVNKARRAIAELALQLIESGSIDLTTEEE
jgi:flagellar motor switch protein FliG